MKKYISIFLLHCQDVFQNKGRAFIYFLMTLLNPLLLLLFWSGAISQNSGAGALWSMSEMTSYYLLITIAMSLLIVHIEEDVAFRDIKEGSLTKYLMRPFSYFISKFMEELPWRIIMGFFAVLVFMLGTIIFRISLPLVSDFYRIVLCLVIIILALCISYVFKMVLGLLAFWTTDFWGILSIEEVIFLVFAGIAMPLPFYPPILEQIAYLLPLSYIIYFPVVSIQGKLASLDMVRVIITQLFWIGLLCYLYAVTWKRGVKKFTSVGQ